MEICAGTNFQAQEKLEIPGNLFIADCSRLIVNRIKPLKNAAGFANDN
jgi:hypothetical protein